jgi:DNA (cytosine-5)-methyltransferase 1
MADAQNCGASVVVNVRSRQFRFVDLFAGLGGFRIAAERAGGKCVFSSEIDEKLRQLYKENFGDEPKGDIRNVEIWDIPRHDLLCAGFPCQPFSKAGTQRGRRDRQRGTLFDEIIRIIEACRPKLVLLENVAHFVRHNDGNTYLRAKKSLEQHGYEVDYRQLSPHQFGIPQVRERIYLVASRGSLARFEWPKPTSNGNDLSIAEVLDGHPGDAQKISSQVESCLSVWQEFLQLFPSSAKLPSFPIWSMEFGATYPYDRCSLWAYSIRQLQRYRGSHGCKLSGRTRQEIEDNLPSHARGSGDVFPRWKRLFIQQNRAFYQQHKQAIDPWLPKILRFPPSLQKLEWNCQGEERNIWKYVLQFRASGVRVKRATTAPSLVAMTTTQVPIIAWEKRYMTNRECARLQSMDTLKYLPEGGAAVTAFGNAVNVKVVEMILRSLLASSGRYDDWGDCLSRRSTTLGS